MTKTLRIGQLTHCFDQVAVIAVGWEAIEVEVHECISASDQNRHPIIEVLLIWQEETAVAKMIARTVLSFDEGPAVARQVLPGATDVTEFLMLSAGSSDHLSTVTYHVPIIRVIHAFAFDHICLCLSFDFVLV